MARNGEMELGFTDVLQKHPTVHLAAEHAHPVPNWLLRYERSRPQLLRECIAEATGVFLYVYCGVAAIASFVLTTVAQQPGFGSLLNIAFAFAFGIASGLIVCAPISGGHMHPAFTLIFATLRGFPWRKVPFYIFSQCFGAFFACVIIYAQWNQQIKEYEAVLNAAGETLISATGPAGIFVAIPLPTQSKGYLFLIEFFADSMIAMVIWAVLNPANPFIAPAGAPFVIGGCYFVMIIGFGAGTFAANTARDFGARCFAAIIYGRGVFTVKDGYAAISGLANIPATFLGVLFYQFIFGDSQKVIDVGHALPQEVHETLMQERSRVQPGQVSEMEKELRRRATKAGDGESLEKSTSRDGYYARDPVNNLKKKASVTYREHNY